MSTFIHLTNARGEVRFSSLPSDVCQGCINKCEVNSQLIKCEFSAKERRQGKINIKNELTYICDDSIDCINSSRKFKEKLNFYTNISGEVGDMRNKIRDEANKKAARLIHNLASLNGHNIQEVYSLVPQDALNKDAKSIMRIIKSYVESNPNGASEVILKIMKNNISMKTEFSVFNKLYDTSPRLSKTSHPIHKIVMNVMHLFYQDFFSKNIDTYVEPTTERIFVDYESTHVAIYHLIENASKYICPNTSLRISSKRIGSYLNLYMDMVSLKINNDELDKIYQDGYSGKHAIQKEKAGNGMGMDIIIKVLELNNAQLYLVPNSKMQPDTIFEEGIYDNNLFVIKFPYSGNPSSFPSGPHLARV